MNNVRRSISSTIVWLRVHRPGIAATSLAMAGIALFYSAQFLGRTVWHEPPKAGNSVYWIRIAGVSVVVLSLLYLFVRQFVKYLDQTEYRTQRQLPSSDRIAYEELSDSDLILRGEASARIKSTLIVSRSQHDTRLRLSKAIEQQRRTSNTNLAIGSFVTLVGIFGLLYTAEGTKDLFLELHEKLKNSEASVAIATGMTVSARLVLSVSVQAVGYFFLVLYRAALSEIRYLENEITTVDIRLSAYISAILNGDEAQISLATQSAIATERNFVLGAGQTTADILKLAAVAKSSDALVSQAVSLAQGMTGGSASSATKAG